MCLWHSYSGAFQTVKLEISNQSYDRMQAHIILWLLMTCCCKLDTKAREGEQKKRLCDWKSTLHGFFLMTGDLKMAASAGTAGTIIICFAAAWSLCERA